MTPLLYKYRPKPLEEYLTEINQTKIDSSIFAYSVYLHPAQALKACNSIKIRVCTIIKLQMDAQSRHLHLLSRVDRHIKNCCRKIYT